MTCDLCGKGLLLDSNARYEVSIEVKSAYDPMEITDEDLERDLESEYEETLKRLERMTARDAMDEVYRTFRFDLCPVCQREYLRDPLGTQRAKFALPEPSRGRPDARDFEGT